MGVTGLWRLIEPAGKPVPVETLENKVLAVDISIWLHQMVKGYQDAKGAPLPNAHLMGLFQRLCKLLYFRIKPVFVFDGGFPDLKRETIARRQDHKAKYHSESERIKRELALILSKKTAINSLLGKQISPKKSTEVPGGDDLFKLPALPQNYESESDSEEETSSSSIADLHSVDLESESFKNKPAKEKYDLLIELKETRKMNSWGRLHELPKKSDSFSDFQMQRLLKRRKVQECLEETEKEMGDTGMSLNDLESLLNEEGIDTKIDEMPGRRIASNESTRYLLIKDVKQALADAKKKNEQEKKPELNKLKDNAEPTESKTDDGVKTKVDELEDDLQKAIKMSLECVDHPNEGASTSKTDDSWTSCMTDTEDSYAYDSEDEDGFEQPDMSSAKAYIMQYSDLTHKTIDKIVAKKSSDTHKTKLPQVNEILEDINNEQSIVVDNINISSSEDDLIIHGKSASGSENEVKELITDPETPTKTEIDTTQASIVCLGQVDEVINLDTSTEENSNSDVNTQQNLYSRTDTEGNSNIKSAVKLQLQSTVQEKEADDIVKSESESSDDEFEEVPDTETNSGKAVVELMLNMGVKPEDDIFEDVFQESKVNTQEILPNKTQSQDDRLDFEDKLAKKDEETNGDVNLKAPDIFHENTQLKTLDVKLNKNNKLEIEVSELKGQNEKSNPHAINIAKDKTERANFTKEKNTTTPQIEVEQTMKEIDLTKEPLKDDIAKTTTEVRHPERQTIENTAVVNAPREITNTETLNTLFDEIQSEEQDLLQEKSRLDRVGRNITEQMTKEAQELLQIFGIPYIVAPMEAEAQCAFLETTNLTDGTITDDSDIWLFGGRTVYKNFFNQKKHVLQFLAERIEKSFNLSREQLILLALLVGSDYTTGVNGVGPVTAMEILASFPFNKRQLLQETSNQAKYAHMVKGLQEFKQWVRAGRRTDNTSLKKKLKNVNLTEEFPSVRVVQAYLEPNIEKSDDNFTWGKLDVTVLRDYTKTKFGWSQNKLDEIIKPVLKRMQDRKTQKSVQDFFKRKVDFQSLDDQLSKRVKAAVGKMGNLDPEKPIDTELQKEKEKPVRKRKLVKTKGDAGTSAKQLKEGDTKVLADQGVKIVTEVKEGKSNFEIKIPKSDRYQEIIPQKEKDKQSLLQNKLKAIELFRKTNIDKKRKVVKRKALKPKEKAELSESDSD